MRSQPPFIIARLGTSNPDDQVRQAVASATLSGRKPSGRAIELIRDVADGKMTGEAALATMRSWYKA